MLSRFYLWLGSALIALYASGAWTGWAYGGALAEKPTGLAAAGGGHGGFLRPYGFRGGK